MLALDVVLVCFALIGHAALCVTALNRSHATALPHWVIRLANLADLAVLTGVPSGIGWLLVERGALPFSAGGWRKLPWFATAYLVAAFIIGIGPTLHWMWRRLRTRPPAALRSTTSTQIDMLERLGGHAVGLSLPRLVLHLPGNECLKLEVTEKLLELPRLAPTLDGLVIAHLSDLHFCGTIDKRYFEHVVELTNEFEADLVAITGDLVDKARYIDWIPDTLGRLRARHGVYFVLGNHDVRIKRDVPRLRRTLEACGLIDLGSRWQRIEIDEQSIVLAGNELPWIAPAAEMANCPPPEEALRILLAHSPDQFGWARRHHCDLMLAGHTHGGQIRAPWLGPIFSPSHFGGTYASGTFHEPPTLMHVSRGLSGLDPLRFNCPPELCKLVLRIAASNPHQSDLALPASV